VYKINIERHFDAAHYLRGYKGKCENIHGHRYKVAVCLSCGSTGENGLVYDFTALKKDLEAVLARFDHTCLNDVSPFDRVNPSAENIARTVYRELKPALKDVSENAGLVSVTVWESPDAWVEYSENQPL
jgi:6-pyruvoyltetrahydropterin/6-carboxytetrahydropterin synthase